MALMLVAKSCWGRCGPGARGVTPGWGVPWLLRPTLAPGGSNTITTTPQDQTAGAAAGEGCPAAEPPAVRLKASVRVHDEGGNSGGPDPGLGFKEAGFSTLAGLPRGGARAPWRSCFRSWAQSTGFPEHYPLPAPGEGSPPPGTAAPQDWSVLVDRGGPGPQGQLRPAWELSPILVCPDLPPCGSPSPSPTPRVCFPGSLLGQTLRSPGSRRSLEPPGPRRMTADLCKRNHIEI